MKSELKICQILPGGDLEKSEESPPISSVVSLSSGQFHFTATTSFPLVIDTIPGVQPAVVINTQGDLLSLKAEIRRFNELDDVFSADFLSFVILVSVNKQLELQKTAQEYLLSRGTRRVALVDRSSWAHGFPQEGPYFATQAGLFRAWKLFPDTQGAFVASLLQDENCRIRYLDAACADAAPNLTIAVPSRLYYPPSPDLPLNGLRVAIKDNIHVAGAKTFGSSKSYGELYGISRTSAPAVQELLDLGAVIIGKTGMSQFADAEAPTSDFVDFHAPANPRGDGNRTAGGSSYGAGAAVAAYKWLDFALATDTGGSCRVPAANNSVFGLRPSRNSVTLDGTLVIHRDLDVLGLLSRDIDVLRRVAVHFYRLSPQITSVNSKNSIKFIYPMHLFPLEDNVVQEHFNKVARAVESILGVTRSNIDFTRAWERWSLGTKGSLNDYFASTLFQHLVWGGYHERAEFRAQYTSTFHRAPMVNPFARYRWGLAEGTTEKEVEQAISKRKEFQSFIESIFGESACMLSPFLFHEPESRDIYRPAPKERDRLQTGWGLRPAYQASLAGQPEIVFPIGLCPTISDISGVEEHYGVIASIIGTRGTELAVLDLICQILDRLKIPRAVLTGRTPFEV
ncbi:amidase signature domain-containing protein [Nemania abortiva]|nr:amidase signature domain-containing protein [Nemania abortiva]